MHYADTDFFIALLKPNDWLCQAANKVLTLHKGNISTSMATVMEILLISEDVGIDPARIIEDIFTISTVLEGNESVAMRAAHYMKKFEMTAFDALHAAYCGNDAIISSDKVFDKIGIKRIKLEQ